MIFPRSPWRDCSLRCPFNSKIIIRRSASRAPRARPRSRRRSANSRASIIPMSQRTRNARKKNSSRPTRLTRCWAIPPNGSVTMNLARTGNRARDSTLHRVGETLVAHAAAQARRIKSSNSMARASATSLNLFSEIVARGVRVVLARTNPNAVRTSKAISW